MIDERVRAVLPRLMTPLARPLARAGVTPNTVTVATFVTAAAAAVLIGTGSPRAGLAVWLVSRLGDGLDGVLARQTGRSSAFGGYLDITLDMTAYSVVALGFAAAHPELGLVWPAILMGYTLAITTTLALSSAAVSAGRRVSDTDRTFQFTTGVAEAGETTVMYVLWVMFPHWLAWLAWMWLAMILLTVVQRTWLASRVLR